MSRFEKMLGESRGPAGGDGEGKPLKPYIPIEEVPDSDVDKKLEKFEERDLSVNLENETVPAHYSKEEAENIKRLHDKLMSQTVNFQQEEENVAHIGPEFFGEEVNDKKEKIGDVVHSRDIYQQKNMRASLLNTFKDRVYKILKPKDQTGHQSFDSYRNLKTLKKVTPKMERAGRGEAREVLHNPEIPEETTWQDFLEDSKN